MAFRGRFRPARHADRAVPEVPPRSLLAPGEGLDVRVWRATGPQTLLIAQAGRRTGRAVARNRFRRQVRAALFQLLGETPLPAPAVLWIRPAKGARCRISYASLLGQLRLALTRFKAKQA